jgi:hypothetical protein
MNNSSEGDHKVRDIIKIKKNKVTKLIQIRDLLH